MKTYLEVNSFPSRHVIYEKRPENFNSRFEIVSCFFECADKILLLHRQDDKPEGNTWGVPAGKIDEGENLAEAMLRELREETGFKLSAEELVYFQKIYVRYSEYDFIYHIFHTKIEEEVQVSISDKEHKDFKWVSPKEALGMPLIPELGSCIKLFYVI